MTQMAGKTAAAQWLPPPCFGGLSSAPAFQALIKDAAAEYLRSPEGQALIAKAIRRELDKR